MTWRVVLSNRTLRDIHRNASWWAENRDAEQALRWYEGILAAIYSLDVNPQRWPLARENAKLPYELKERHFGISSNATHRILFTLRKDEDTVVVLSVRHAAQADVRHDELT